MGNQTKHYFNQTMRELVPIFLETIFQ